MKIPPQFSPGSGGRWADFWAKRREKEVNFREEKGVSAHVYITNNKIQVLTGSCVKNKLQVVNFYEEPLEEGCILNGIIMNNYSLQNTLTQMWQKNNLPTKM